MGEILIGVSSFDRGFDLNNLWRMWTLPLARFPL
jgi:hypothetical protein